MVLQHCSRQSLTVQKLFTKRLNTLNITTNKIALHFALNPTTTITHATSPNRLTATLVNPHSPLHMNPTNKRINNIRPASWMYFFLSFSAGSGRPAGANFFLTQLSLRTMRRPPITLRLRRKKLRSKMRPYPRACVTTTPIRPKTAYSGYLRMMTRVEQVHMATTLRRRKRWVRPHGTGIT